MPPKKLRQQEQPYQKQKVKPKYKETQNQKKEKEDIEILEDLKEKNNPFYEKQQNIYEKSQQFKNQRRNHITQDYLPMPYKQIPALSFNKEDFPLNRSYESYIQNYWDNKMRIQDLLMFEEYDDIKQRKLFDSLQNTTFDFNNCVEISQFDINLYGTQDIEYFSDIKALEQNFMSEDDDVLFDKFESIFKLELKNDQLKQQIKQLIQEQQNSLKMIQSGPQHEGINQLYVENQFQKIAIEQELKEEQKNNSAMKQQISKLNKDLETSKIKHQDLQKMIKDLQEGSEKKNNSVVIAIGNLDTKQNVNFYQQRVDELKEDEQKLKQELYFENIQKAKVDSLVKVYENQLNILKQDNEKLQNQLSSKSKPDDELEQNNLILNQELESLRSDEQNLRKSLDQLKADNSQLNVELNTSKTQILTQTTIIDNLEDKVKSYVRFYNSFKKTQNQIEDKLFKDSIFGYNHREESEDEQLIDEKKDQQLKFQELLEVNRQNTKSDIKQEIQEIVPLLLNQITQFQQYSQKLQNLYQPVQQELKNEIQTIQRQNQVLPKQQNIQLQNDVDNQNKLQEFIQWDKEETYDINIFSKLLGHISLKRKYQIHIIPYTQTKDILKIYLMKFTFSLRDILIFNYKQEISIIIVGFNVNTQVSFNQMRIFFKDNKFLIVWERPSIKIIDKISSLCTVQLNRQRSKYFHKQPYKVKGIASIQHQFILYGTALCFIYKNVDNFDKFVEYLRNSSCAFQSTKQVLSKECIIINYNNCKYIYIIVVFPQLKKETTFNCKDFFQDINKNQLHQILVSSISNPDVNRIKQFIVRKEDFNKDLIQWFTDERGIKPETEEEKQESFNSYFKQPQEQQNSESDEENAQLLQDKKQQKEAVIESSDSE